MVAAVLDPVSVNAPRYGFDNKANYIHQSGGGLSSQIARGLAMYLNSTMVDRYFRIYSGHTQVNAADLRRLPFPASDVLLSLSAAWQNDLSQAALDCVVEGRIIKR